MKRILGWTLLLFVCQAALAQMAQTPNLGLNLPPQGYPNWANLNNQNFVTIDAVVGGLQKQWQGTWTSAVTYQPAQIVTWQASSYISITGTNANNQPDLSPGYWAKIGTTAAGAVNELQMNAGGSFAATTGMTYDLTSNTLRAPQVNVSGNIQGVSLKLSGLAPGSALVCTSGTDGTLTNGACSVPPASVAWPPSCTGVYAPATNTCVAVGTAANPAGNVKEVQFNAGGTFGTDSAITIDNSTHTLGSQNVSGSANTVLYVKAPPYNAKCDVHVGGLGDAVITSGTTTYGGFSTADVGKTVKGVSSQANGSVSYVGKIVSWVGGTTTLSPAATITLHYWEWATDDHDSLMAALNDAYAQNVEIQLPAGQCLTSTLVWKGQSFHGSGRGVSYVRGMPGQDVFQMPEYGTSYSITSWSITGNVATFQTTSNNLLAGNVVTLGGFGTSTFFNLQTVTVTSATGTQFVAPITHANGSATEAGFAATGGAFPITSWSITGNVATVQVANNFPAGANITLSRFGTSTFFNAQNVTILAAGLSPTQFSFNFTHANGSATESGLATTQATSIRQFNVHDLSIVIDSTVNAAATAAGGNNTFPYRIGGTFQGMTPFTPPPAPGVPVFGTCGAGGGYADAGGTLVTITCPLTGLPLNLASLEPTWVINAPITVDGAGAAGGVYAGHIQSIVNDGVTSVSGSGGSGMTVGTYPLSFSGGGGSGASGTIAVTNATTYVVLLRVGGAGYTSPPTVTAATGGTPPTFTAAIGTSCAGGTICTVRVDNAIATSVSATTGTWLTAQTPPWYFGNAGIAMPCSGGGACNGVGFSVIRNVNFDQVANGYIGRSHTTGIFTQAQMYGDSFENLVFTQLYGGYIEVQPPAGNLSTADTMSFKDISFYNENFPIMTYNGNDRVINGMNIYQELLLSEGPFFFSRQQALSGYLNWAINSFYIEGGASTNGEWARFQGGPFHMRAASFGGGNPAGSYIEFTGGGSSLWEGGIGGALHIDGSNMNTFRNTGILPGSGLIVDNGHGNIFETQYVAGVRQYLGRRVYAGTKPARKPVGEMDGSAIVGGSATTPYYSASDLMTTCSDWAFAYYPGTTAGSCVSDPSGTELPHGYFESATPTPGFDIVNASPGGGWAGGPRLFGGHAPLQKVRVYVTGRCVGAGCAATTLATYRDSPTSTEFGRATLNFTSSWSTQSFPADASNGVAGNIPNVTMTGWTNTGTAYDIAMITIQPIPTDTINVTYLGNTPSQAAAAFGSPVILSMEKVTTGVSVFSLPDSTSPTGFSNTATASGGWICCTTFPNGTGVYLGGRDFPTSYGVLQWTVQGPSVWTDTLNGLLTNVATTCTLTTFNTSTWQANGYFLIDQEILGYTGAVPGSNGFTCTRGNFGTIAQQHSNGAAVSSVGTTNFLTKCNNLDASTGRSTVVPILPTWQQYRQAFVGTACSGYTPAFQMFAGTGPTGQTFKVASITIESLQGVLPQPTAANQVLSSGAVLTGGAGYAFNTLTTMPPVRAGTWAISAATSAPITFAPVMLATPTSCAVTPSASAATTGTPFASSLATTGFTVNVPTSGSLSGTYLCAITNAY
jgi:hypothetical protein